jgi:hypothetical protein
MVANNSAPIRRTGGSRRAAARSQQRRDPLELAGTIPDEDYQAMVRQRPQQRPVSNAAINFAEGTHQPVRSAGYIGRRHQRADATPVDESEFGMKGPLDLADREMVHANVERGGEPSGAPSPKRCSRLAAQQIPYRFPKAKTT